jgi:hypothetical protein
MAIKTFTTGEVLTASDTNTYLANSGLVYIKQQTIGNAVATQAVTNAFSADYDNYRIVISGGVGSTVSTSIRLKLTGSSSGYYGVMPYVLYGTTTLLYANDNNTNQFSFVGNAGTNQGATAFDILNPFLAKWTTLQNATWVANNGTGNYNGVHQVATSYTAFDITPETGTLTGGIIFVYGYRKS